jgi:hypothetical protein
MLHIAPQSREQKTKVAKPTKRMQNHPPATPTPLLTVLQTTGERGMAVLSTRFSQSLYCL